MIRTLSTLRVIGGGVSALVLLTTGSIAIGWRVPWLVLNENQVLYLFSTTAQVIAAVYGLTVTGFIFFRNELTREAEEDETLAEPIEELKQRYYRQLIFITAVVAMTLALANLTIAHVGSQHHFATVVLINAGQSSFAVSLLAVALFVFDVIAPQRVERASQGLQDALDPQRGQGARGSLEKFLATYNQVEALLNEEAQRYRSVQSPSVDWRPQRRLSNMRLAEILLRNERIDEELYNRLRELITLRNAIIHGAEPVVSQEVVSASATVLTELRQALVRREQ